jgi:ATP synthase protein I
MLKDGCFPMDKETKKTIKTLGYLSTVGLAMAFSIGIGAYIGYYLDKVFQTRPWFSFIFLGLGIIAAFRNLYVMYKRMKNI